MYHSKSQVLSPDFHTNEDGAETSNNSRLMFFKPSQMRTVLSFSSLPMHANSCVLLGIFHSFNTFCDILINSVISIETA